MVKSFIACGVFGLVTLGQASAQAPFLERLLALSALVDIRGTNYSQSQRDSTLIYTEALRQPLVVEVSIGNNTDEDVAIGSPQGGWVTALTFRLSRMQDSGREDLTREMTFRMVQSQTAGIPQVLSIAPGRSTRIRFAFERGVPTPLTSARYELTVGIRDDLLNARARRHMNVLTRTVSFEIREPKTNAELADAYLQLSTLASVAGRFAESRDWAQRVLNLNPVSVPALVDQAMAWSAEGNCSQAVPLFNRAIGLLESGADAELQVSGMGRSDWAAGLRGIVRTRCRTA
jgi:tetratricopeptide (TPR) repeat protein